MEVCVLASGSSGNCVYIGTRQARILIDAGISARRIDIGLKELGLSAGELDAVFVTHEHADHIAGIRTLARRYRVPVYATASTWEAAGNNIGEVPEDAVRHVSLRGGLGVKDLWVEAFSTWHDAADPVGYTVTDGRDKVGLLTDSGAVPEEAFSRLAGARALVFETNHDVQMLQQGGYPVWLKRRILGDRGHLSNVVAAAALARLLSERAPGACRVFLAHLSQENNRPDLAYEAVAGALTEQGIKPGADVELVVAHRDRMSDLYKVG